jgi:hypothetical protein
MGDQLSMEPWELSAREGCRDAMARYTHAGDRFQMEAFVDAFTADGVLEIRGEPSLEGREAIFARFTDHPISESTDPARPRPTIIRHTISNILFEDVSPGEVRVGSYFTVFTDIGTDHMGRYRDTLVPDGARWRFTHRFVSVDWHASGSLMVSELHSR